MEDANDATRTSTSRKRADVQNHLWEDADDSNAESGNGSIKRSTGRSVLRGRKKILIVFATVALLLITTMVVLLAVFLPKNRKPLHSSSVSSQEGKTDNSEPATLQSPIPSHFTSMYPSDIPSLEPSKLPSLEPSIVPSLAPSDLPSSRPSVAPSLRPSADPYLESNFPSTTSTNEPSAAPATSPSAIPSLRPASKMPSVSFTFAPSNAPLPASTPPTMQTSSTPTESASFTVEGSFELLDTVSHDINAFTQGLELVPNNPLQYFESTGLYGQSSVLRVELMSGQVLQRHDLDPRYFGEGLTNFNGKIIQLTWLEQTAFIYNSTNLEVLDEFDYTGNTNGEGWGICYVEANNTFFVTDGSANLHTWDATSYELLKQTPVFLQADELLVPEEVDNLNELEWDVHSQTILANIWLKDDIVRIDPVTGMVLARYDLSSLFRPLEADVLNGIAITDTPNEIWVTGKLWPHMYLIRLLDYK